MDITLLKDWQFKLKGKTGALYTADLGFRIESAKDASEKEITGAGEFEVAGISVIGVKSYSSVVYVYEVDGVRICNFGKLLDKLEENKLTQLGDIDVLLLPITAKSVEIMQQIEPYYIIPYGYSTQEELDKFVNESGLTVQKLPKFTLKKEEIIEDQTAELIVLEIK